MITKQISLNTWSTNETIVYANSGEVDSRYIQVSFKDEKKANISLEDKTVTFYAKKPDNTTIFNYCTINTTTNTATVELTSQALSVPGILDCEFQIFDGDNVLLKVNGLKIFVSDSKDFSESIESTSESNVLSSLINTTNDLSDALGSLNNLNTTEKGTIVGAINEVNSKTIPISQGGTGASTASDALTNLEVAPIVLYSNESGTTGSFIISQPYTKFSRIGVYVQGQYDDKAASYNEIHKPLNYMSLECSSIADSNYNCTVWRTAFIHFTGNAVTFATNASSSYSSEVGYNVSVEDGLKIVRVVGYKY